IGFLVAADRRIVNASSDLRVGKWRKNEYGKSYGLKGRTLGVIGTGAIGQAVIRRAQGLEMNVIAWSIELTPEMAEGLGIEYCKSYMEVAKRSDAVSLHIALAPETKSMINREFLSQMKPGAILINTSRGEVINTSDLKEAIRDKKLRVALDVFENEPAGGDDSFIDTELAQMVTCTPHIGASTDQSTEAIADEVVNIVAHFKKTGKALNTVNTRSQTIGGASLVVRHFNKVGVLADLLDKLKDEDINVEEMENMIFECGEAACCSLKLDKMPSEKTLRLIKDNRNIIQSELKL
ncbi:MAG: hydroxyacid dehydrogenase, partial [Oligoflexales bacterium]|nr:hydroxyacid dehydrogenase [Oligoflexales bacterium]